MPDDRKLPPPLPPRPIVPEPFVDLTETPEPQSIRMRSTPPSGSLLLRREVERLSEDPKDATIRELRIIIGHQRQALIDGQPAPMPNTVPSPIPDAAPKSRAAVVAAGAGKVGFNLGKYTTLVVGALGLADVVVGLWFPQYKGPLATIKGALGIP